MTLATEQDFHVALTEFVNKYNEFSKEKWTLHKSSEGIYAKQSVMVKWRKVVVNRQAHITFSSVYSVPTLWFNIYMRDGIPLSAEEALELSVNINSLDLAKNMSQNEHPILGLLFYNIHPCHTEKVMNELKGSGNYIAKWLSVYGTPIGVSVPFEMFNRPSEISVSSTDDSCSASQCSEDGST